MRAQGTYHYTLAGVLQEVGEPWTLERTDTGFHLEGQRLLRGKPTLVVVADFTGTACTSLRLDWLGVGDPRTVRYRIDGDELEWSDGDRPAQRLMLPPRCLMFPLLRASTGPLLQGLVNTSRPVLMPDLRAPRSSQFLKPLLSDRRTEQPAGPGGSRYRYYGGEYGDEGSDWWVNQQGLVSQYTWETPQGKWDVRLESLAADKDFNFDWPKSGS